jgi:hypothetical protein
MNSNKYQTESKRTLAYYTEDLSWIFGKDDWDNNNTGYTDTVRYRINKDIGIGNRRQYSLNILESGNFNGLHSGILPMLDFVVTYHTAMPYAKKYHGANMILSGEFSIGQVSTMLDNIGTADNGSQYNLIHATSNSDGIRVTIQIVRLRRGKLNEKVYLNGEGKLLVADDTLKPFSREPKKYRRNRKALS